MVHKHGGFCGDFMKVVDELEGVAEVRKHEKEFQKKIYDILRELISKYTLATNSERTRY